MFRSSSMSAAVLPVRLSTGFSATTHEPQLVGFLLHVVSVTRVTPGGTWRPPTNQSAVAVVPSKSGKSLAR